MQNVLQKAARYASRNQMAIWLELHDHLLHVSLNITGKTKVQLTQSLSWGACPMPISSKVFGPLPGGEATAGFAAGAAAGLLAGAGADAGAACGGGLCCCVGALCGLGVPSWP